jgi:LacI family transcriptional regulator
MRFLGRSPKDEILRVRLNRVKQLLKETDFSLSQIAEKVGLDHVEHLSRIFKIRTGMNPSAFRSESLIRNKSGRPVSGLAV